MLTTLPSFLRETYTDGSPPELAARRFDAGLSRAGHATQPNRARRRGNHEPRAAVEETRDVTGQDPKPTRCGETPREANRPPQLKQTAFEA
jgi:hypothetical protein